MNEDMIIDTENFDIFNQLDDLPDMINSESEEVEDEEAEEYDELDEFDFENDDEDSEEAEDEDSDEITEEDLDEDELVKTALQSFDQLDDSVTLKVGDVELSKADVVKLVESREEITSSKKAIEHFASQFEQESLNMNALLQASISEASQLRMHYQAQLDDPKITNVEKGEIYQKMQYYANKEQALMGNVKEYRQRAEQRDQVNFQAKLMQINQEMGKAVPDWSTKQAELGEYIRSTGVDPVAFMKSATAPLLQALMNGMKFESVYKDKQKTIKSNLKGKTKRAVKSVAPTTTKKTADKNKLKRIASKMNRGAASSSELSEVFDFLSD